jgi:hypothetical protein
MIDRTARPTVTTEPARAATHRTAALAAGAR